MYVYRYSDIILSYFVKCTLYHPIHYLDYGKKSKIQFHASIQYSTLAPTLILLKNVFVLAVGAESMLGTTKTGRLNN